jgi:type I restriction enzyme, S subunit
MTCELQPYPEYKDSSLKWLGRIPQHWNEQPGLALFCVKQEKNLALREKRVLSLSYGRIIIKPTEKLHGLVPESFETYQIVNPGDIIIRPTDLQNDWNSLRVGLVRDRGIITSAYLCFRNLGSFTPEFAFLLLHSYDLQKFFYGLGSGLRQNLDFSDFKRLPFPIPPPEEQRAIVRFLDHANARIERAIRAKRKLVALLNEQKQAIIHRAVTRGVDPDIRVQPCSSRWFPSIPRAWEVITMRRAIRSAIDGPHFSPNYLSEGIPFLSARNIRPNHWLLADAKFISKADYKEFSRRVRPEKGDVLYTKGGTTGVAKVVDLDFPFQVWVHIAVLKVATERVLPEYLALCLNSPR